MSGGPFDVTLSDDGLSYRVELNAHYMSDETLRQVKELFDAIKRENAELRELVRDVWSAYHDGATNREFRALSDRMHELGIEVVK